MVYGVFISGLRCVMCKEDSLERVEEITGQKVTCYVVDLLDKPALQEVFQKVNQRCANITHHSQII